MTIQISYVSDVLCIWAYVAEARLDQLRKEFGSSIELDYRFIPIFGATRNRIAEGWKKRGGYAGFGEHVLKVAEGFPHVSVNERVWSEVAPTTSSAAHEMLCAARLLEAEGLVDSARRDELGGRTLFEEAVWQIRLGFFEQARDISDRNVLLDVLEQLGLPTPAIEGKLSSGRSHGRAVPRHRAPRRAQDRGQPDLLPEPRTAEALRQRRLSCRVRQPARASRAAGSPGFLVLISPAPSPRGRLSGFESRASAPFTLAGPRPSSRMMPSTRPPPARAAT